MFQPQRIVLVALLQLFAVSLLGCQSPGLATAQDPAQIPGIEFIVKKPDFGGEACVAMCLRKFGWDVDQDFVFDQANVDPIEGRGCNTAELVAAVKSLGIEPGAVWYPISEANRAAVFAERFEELKRDISAKIPWVVCLQVDQGQQFALVIGYNARQSQLILQNPSLEKGEGVRMSVDEFKQKWVLTDQSNQEFLVKLRMTKPTRSLGELPEGFTDADYAQHVRKLKAGMPDGDFKIIIEKPFVVIGDEDLDVVQRRSTRTVGWATKRLKEVYFSNDPKYILDVWLFKDKESYETNTKKLTGRTPTTPFGFYNSYHRALIMNISTGGGTLVHEIVHPFIESNFEDCPSWFNEGFASLYEQCRDNDGRIWGSTNWRLRGLQLAIRDDRVPSFQELCSTTRDEFYDEDPGTNYSQARYLCYYLQQNGKLVEFYETFRDNIDVDPTGVKSLRQVLGRNDLEAFQADWQAYVLKLRF